jgi:hypothetical protein
MVLEVDDEVAENMKAAPGLITFDGVTIGEEGVVVGYINENEVEPVDVDIRVEELSREHLASFVEG